ncbi:11535_t:CDS:2, partial [Gigaspora margarita]
KNANQMDLRDCISLRTNIPNDRSLGPQKILGSAEEATEYFVNEVLVKSWTTLESYDKSHDYKEIANSTDNNINKYQKYSSSPNYLGNSAKAYKIDSPIYNEFRKTYPENIKSPSIVKSMVIDANFKKTMEIFEQETSHYHQNEIDNPEAYTTNRQIDEYIENVEVTETMKDFIDLKNKFIRHHD